MTDHSKVYGFCEAKCKVEVVDKATFDEHVVGIFNNVSASSWVEDSTYADYGYRCAINLTGVTASNVAEVVFGTMEATRGNYAPICETYNGGVYIYSNVNVEISIPTIIVMKGVVE